MMGYKTKPSPGLLILLCSVPNILCICPLTCACSLRNRNVDCSGRNLTALLHGLQDNVTHLNVSHNHFTNLDYELTRFTNLRMLDLSYNLLKNLPSNLPRSLWAVYASNNNIKALHKLDTAYQWNLKILDVSNNRLQRTVFINNTLTSLQLLNLSNNHLWTVPTNMPPNIQIIDLSNNFLIQILPGTLGRLHNLQKFYLHNNRFTYIPDNAFDQLTNLHEITLYNNPWTCKDTHNILYLLKWVSAPAKNITGYPCSNETNQFTTAPYSPTIVAPNRTVNYNSLLTTTVWMFMEAQEKKMYKQVPVPEAATLSPINTTSILLPSADDFLLTDEGSADEIMHFDYNFSTKDVPLIPSSELEVLISDELYDNEFEDSTVTFGNRKGSPDSVPEMTMYSTTVPIVAQHTTISIKQVRSLAHKATCQLVSFVTVVFVLRTI
ncbi:oligodendrocyte-myelin glycoprotein isoform X1 [Pelobates fuscus]|uniref:oligodendrocyte-myelin glycoprotein isoform X1 n=1 Tax=Pelobates fuscus TaxID=191477 RepID=UPI002FE4DDD4